jgi:hypothetical protein
MAFGANIIHSVLIANSTTNHSYSKEYGYSRAFFHLYEYLASYGTSKGLPLEMSRKLSHPALRGGFYLCTVKRAYPIKTFGRTHFSPLVCMPQRALEVRRLRVTCKLH